MREAANSGGHVKMFTKGIEPPRSPPQDQAGKNHHADIQAAPGLNRQGLDDGTDAKNEKNIEDVGPDNISHGNVSIAFIGRI